MSALGSAYARALAATDYDQIVALLHPAVDFRGMTPKRVWEASDPETVVSAVLRHWFEDSDEIESLERLESDAFADVRPCRARPRRAR